MKKKALLVNDSKFESLILRDMLNKLDYEVEIADEFDAVYEVEQFNPDVIIVNYIMQETTGDELIDEIKNGCPTAKCLLSSNSTIKISAFSGKKIDGILQTPASMFSLTDTLERLGIGSLSKNNSSEPIRSCRSCNKDLSELVEHIVFCPFCGEKIN